MATFIGLGEGLVRLSPPDHQRIEQANMFEVQIGGAELNVCVALSRLGIEAAWISKLTNNPIGRLITNRARQYGVDVSRVVWTDAGRVGLYFFELGSTPRANAVIYDRAHSAINTLNADELDWEFISRAKVMHLTGITPALSSSARQLVKEIVARLKGLDVLLSFDVNYRGRLWTVEEARRTLLELLPSVDFLFVTLEDAKAVIGLNGTPEEIVKQLRKEFARVVAMLTFSEGGAMACHDGSTVYYQPPYELTVVDRLGAGDAFVAGAIYGWLNGASWEKCLANAVAMAAFKCTIPGDFAIVEISELETLLSKSAIAVRR
ncbi:MAG: sugar kinase [Armatimonadota bacterium]|nr:sugar kinase [Armatimonadota bacterium]MCX7777075.1 sugar kinase [Armatimonadota bacterium]MDW8024855.1 sugar kinase [Armatimonadota bacterium]